MMARAAARPPREAPTYQCLEGMTSGVTATSPEAYNDDIEAFVGCMRETLRLRSRFN